MMMTMSELAAELHVSRQQVFSWYQRRDRNGFPEPCGTRPYGGHQRRVWHLHEVKGWRDEYVPSRGGRPKSSKEPVDT